MADLPCSRSGREMLRVFLRPSPSLNRNGVRVRTVLRLLPGPLNVDVVDKDSVAYPQ